jgi:outer membrane protein assembly factor BamE (lipoprotein component of BamABCDE complex)|tara:strand:+ start:144 stop:569 length:426 start_codon:yes stop_codon:yes gene_type:complete
MFKFLTATFLLLFLSHCEKEVRHSPDNINKLTLGKVQQTLKKGMSQGEIIVALGSPNMVTSDANGLETWVYDKLSTEVNSNSQKKSFNLLGGVIGSKIGVGATGGSSSKNSNTSSSQKTLTVVLKFIEKKLETYTYNASSF